MSNYSVITDWDGKDALADSNPAKVISGDEFQDEFDAIATAVATKADINGNSAESFSASTAPSGTNTTQVATTAYVQGEFTAANINDAAYPVGSIYISVVSTNPATLLGVGTWTAFATGKTLIGIDSGDTSFDTVEETGGAKTHALTEAEMPKHYHLMLGPNSVSSPQGSGSGVGNYGGGTPDDGTQAYGTYSTGGDASSGDQVTGTSNGDAHNNLPPYIVTYMWKRTA